MTVGEKRVRFACKDPTPTKVCGECGYRGIPLRKHPSTETSEPNSKAFLRTMHECYQCGAFECSYCARFLSPIVCELCRISYLMLGQYRCT